MSTTGPSRLRPSSVLALLVACAALFVALGGPGYAAAAAAKITGADVKNGSLTGADLKKGSLGADRLTPAAVASLAGATGPAGPAGPQGPAGVVGAHLVSGTPVTVAANGGYEFATVTCPTGEHVVGTGVSQHTPNNAVDALLAIADQEISADRTTVTVLARNTNTSATALTAQAVCAP